MTKVRSTVRFTGMATLLATTWDEDPITGIVPLVIYLVCIRFSESERIVMVASWATRSNASLPLLATDTMMLYVFCGQSPSDGTSRATIEASVAAIWFAYAPMYVGSERCWPRMSCITSAMRRHSIPVKSVGSRLFSAFDIGGSRDMLFVLVVMAPSNSPMEFRATVV